MILSRKDDDFEPVTWVHGYPVYASAMLGALHVIALIVAALLFAFRLEDWLVPFRFSSTRVLEHAEIWRCLTYVFVHEPADIIGLAIEICILYFLGREVERFIGRRAFFALYGCLVLAAPVVLSFSALISSPNGLVGSGGVHLGVFIAFATLYPTAELIFRIQARWIAWVLLAIFTLGDLAARQWSTMFVLWGNATTAWCFIGWVRGTLTFPSFPRLTWPVTSRKTAARPPSPPRRSRNQPAPVDPMTIIDPLLEKIGQSGMESLTAEERSKLAEAREALLKEELRRKK